MDTRTKIVPRQDLDDLLRNDDRAATWVSGQFDPLLAEHVGRLAAARRPGQLLVVEVTNPPQPLLSQRARAELVAALSMVDYVVLRNVDAGALPLDEDLTERFVEHVLQRHAQESSR